MSVSNAIVPSVTSWPSICHHANRKQGAKPDLTPTHRILVSWRDIGDPRRVPLGPSPSAEPGLGLFLWDRGHREAQPWTERSSHSSVDGQQRREMQTTLNC